MSITDLPPLGPAPEDLETRRLRQQMALALFGAQAPDLMTIGRFKLLHELGAGGQGIVYEAQDPELERRVALKRLTVVDEEHRARMRQEGRALARVDHPNVVRIYEVGEDRAGQPYLVMELVTGKRLDRWLHHEPRHWAEVVALLVEIGDGLAAIHDAGVVHRDVKPSNIIIQPDGRAKLIDLGISVLDVSEAEGDEQDIAGTVGYIAPEQRLGQSDPRSDQFGFCVTLYEALCGARPPWSMTRLTSLPAGPFPESLGSATEPAGTDGTSPRASIGIDAAPRQLRDVLSQGMQDDPARRFDDTHALVAALRGVLPQPRRVSSSAVAGLVLLGVVVGGATIALLPDPVTGPCEVTSPTQALWAEPSRQVVADHFAEVGGGAADEVFTKVDAMLTETTTALDARWVAACGLPKDDGARAMAVAEQQANHATLGVIVDSLTSVDGSTIVDVPVRLGGTLVELQDSAPRDRCEQTEAMLEATPQIEQIEQTRRQALAESIAGRYEPALKLATQALDATEGQSLEPMRARLLLERGRLNLDALQTDEALDDLEAARSQAEIQGCDGLGARALTHYAKAQLVEEHGSLDRADGASRLALEKLDRIGLEGPRRAEALKSRGLVLLRQRKLEEAAEHYERALEIWGRAEVSAPLDVTDAMLNLAVIQAQLGNLDDAVATLLDAIDQRSAVLGSEHPSLYKLHASLSYRYLAQDKLAESQTELSRALALAEAGLGPKHPRVAKLHIAMTRVLDRQHDFTGALRHATKADEIFVAAYGENDLRRIDALEAIGQVHLDAKTSSEAIAPLEKALEIQTASSKGTPWDLVIGRTKLARAHALIGDYEPALEMFSLAYRVLEAVPSRRSDPFVAEMLMSWGEALVSADRASEAVTILGEAAQRWSELGTNPEREAVTQWWLARAKCATAPEDARVQAEEALRYFGSVDTDAAKTRRAEITAWLEQGCPSPVG